MVGAAMANYATPDPADDRGHLGPLDVCNGHSVAFSGIKFDREGNVLDHKLVEAGEGEELLIATFDLDALRAYRAYEIGGDAYRKPAFYQALSDATPLPVLARADSRRTPLRAYSRPRASSHTSAAAARRLSHREATLERPSRTTTTASDCRSSAPAPSPTTPRSPRTRGRSVASR
jgi:hypothetical protein